MPSKRARELVEVFEIAAQKYDSDFVLPEDKELALVELNVARSALHAYIRELEEHRVPSP